MIKIHRGSKLKDDETIFYDPELSLIDGLGDMREILRRRYGKKSSSSLSVADAHCSVKVLGVNTALDLSAERHAARAVSGLAEIAKEKALWLRFCL